MRSLLLFALLACAAAALPAGAAADGRIGAALEEDTFTGLALEYLGDDGASDLRLGTWYDGAGRRWAVVRDRAGRIDAGPRCLQLDAHAVRCTSFGLEPALDLLLRGGDDSLRFRRSTWGWGIVSVFGGEGDDRMDARRWVDDPSPGSLWLEGEDGDDVFLSPRKRAEEEPFVLGGRGADVSCGVAYENDFGRHDRIYGPGERCPR